jgi:outer membrane immunogenic protein
MNGTRDDSFRGGLKGIGAMRKLILAGASLVFAGTLALAGSAQAANVAPFTWTGVYLGINAGYGTSNSDGSSYCTNAAGVVTGPGCWASMPTGLSSSGGFVGGQIGANYQTGLFVWGVETDIQVAHINDGTGALDVTCCTRTIGPLAPVDPGQNYALTRAQNMDWFGTVRGRLGLAIWDRTLIYGTAGLMYAEEVVNSNVVAPASVAPPAGATYQAQSSGTHTGWVAGGGLEYAFTNAISAKVEGLYYNIGSETVAWTHPVTQLTNTTAFSYSGALVRLGANLKFGP